MLIKRQTDFQIHALTLTHSFPTLKQKHNHFSIGNLSTISRKVDESRQIQMAHKARRREMERKESDAFTRNMLADVEVKIAEDKEKQRKKKADRIEASKFIEAQIAERARKRAQYKEEEAERVRLEQEAAGLYQKKIDLLYDLKLGVPNHKRKKVQWYY